MGMDFKEEMVRSGMIMTKTIEFVERIIKDKKDQLKRLKNLKTISNKYELQINELLTKNTEEDIEYLQQIKAELEEWEVAKKHLILDKEFHQIDLHLHHDTIYKEDYLKLKKALEGKNE